MTIKSCIGSSVVITTDMRTSEGDAYLAGEIGSVVDEALDRDDGRFVVLVSFDKSRDLLTCVPGDNAFLLRR